MFVLAIPSSFSLRFCSQMYLRFYSKDAECSCIIHACQPSDSGTYRCEILNEKTAVDCTARLTVVPKHVEPRFTQVCVYLSNPLNEGRID